MFTERQIIDFERLVSFKKYTILRYLDAVYDYQEKKLPILVNFFAGYSDSISEGIFSELKDLIQKGDDIALQVQNYNFNLGNYSYWELNDFLDDLRSELFTITKTSKFLRSSKTNGNFSGEIERSYSLKSGQTLEQLSNSVLADGDSDNQWQDIAMRNNFSELDYELKGGEILIIKLRTEDQNSDIKSVIDNMINERILGKDLYRYITFENEDLKTVDYHNCVQQSVEILTDLIKGDIPEFPTLGRSTKVGSTLNSFRGDSTIRELSYVFSSDDTLVNFSVLSFERSDAEISLTFKVSDRLSNEVEQKKSIQ